MSDFKKKIDEINKKRTPRFVSLTSQQIQYYKEEAQQYIDEICKTVKDAIEAKANAGSVEYDDKRTFFNNFKKVSPHYIYDWCTSIEFNFQEPCFEYKEIACDFDGDWKNFRKGFVLNHPKLIFYIYEEVSKQLKTDGIIPVVAESVGSIHSGLIVHKKTSIPTQAQINEIELYYKNFGKKRCCGYSDCGLPITITFAYYVDV